MKQLILSVGLVIICVTSAWGQQDQAGAQGGRPHGPPPEAYTACEGKVAGDSAQLTTPHGDTLTGTCEEQDGRLVLRPDNPPQGGGRPD